MSRVYDAVKDCIGYRRVTHHVAPVRGRVLRCDDNGFPLMPVLDDFKQYGTLLGIKRHDEQVVKDEQPASLNLLESENSEAKTAIFVALLRFFVQKRLVVSKKRYNFALAKPKIQHSSRRGG